MSDDGRNLAAKVTLALRVMSKGKRRVFVLRDNLTIGNDHLSDIYVDHPDRFHAIIRYEEGMFVIHTCGNYAVEGPAGPTRSMALRAGDYFYAWETSCQCFDLQVDPDQADEPATSSVPKRIACPRCRASLIALAPDAQFCPHCGAPLPEDCPDWPTIYPVPTAGIRNPRRSGWIATWFRSHFAADPLFFGRRTTVLAYINTLFNLGLKSEASSEPSRNLDEAARYYRKAAKLGNIPARVRLKVKRF